MKRGDLMLFSVYLFIFLFCWGLKIDRVLLGGSDLLPGIPGYLRGGGRGWLRAPQQL